MAKGIKTGGRKRGTPNKLEAYATFSERACAKHGINVFNFAAEVIAGKAQCGTCHGSGKTKYRADGGELFDRLCESCYGTKLEKTALRDRLFAMKFLGDKIEGNKMNVEHKGDENNPVQHKVVVTFVKADGSSRN